MVTQLEIELANRFINSLANYIAQPMRDEYSAELAELIADHVAQETKALMGVLVIAQKALSKMTVINAEEELVEVRHALTVIASKTKGGN